MISLQVTIGGNGPVGINLASGLITNIHVRPPDDGNSLGLQITDLQPGGVSLTSVNGLLNTAVIDITEGPDPVWLSFSIDCTAGGSAAVGFAGSPTATVNPGSWLTLEYNNGNQPFPA